MNARNDEEMDYVTCPTNEIQTGAPKKCVVTGGNGMVGRRLITMLLERGTEYVVSIDIVAPPNDKNIDKRIKWIQADITDFDALCFSKAFEDDIDTVFHIAAIVGPYHKHSLFLKVNYYGTKNILKCCNKYNIQTLVDCSSPSTRYTFDDINGMNEVDFIKRGNGNPYPDVYTHEYARTKALAEQAVLNANNKNGLLTTVIAPHQIYGPQDTLFLPSIINNIKRNRLFIMGSGQYIVSFTHVDNVCYALILAANSLLNSKTKKISAGQFYFVTDNGVANFWDRIDVALDIYNKINGTKFTRLRYKMHLSKYFLLMIAYCCSLYTLITSKFTTLNPFAVKMITMNRYFNNGKIKKELGYKSLVEFEKGWVDVVSAVVNRIRKHD
eukprot:472106_1